MRTDEAAIRLRLSQCNFDDPSENIGRMAIVPQGPRLLGQRQSRDALGELRIVEITGINISVAIRPPDQALAIKAIRDAGGLLHQIFDGYGSVQRNQFQAAFAVVRLLFDAYPLRSRRRECIWRWGRPAPACPD